MECRVNCILIVKFIKQYIQAKACVCKQPTVCFETGHPLLARDMFYFSNTLITSSLCLLDQNAYICIHKSRINRDPLVQFLLLAKRRPSTPKNVITFSSYYLWWSSSTCKYFTPTTSSQ